MFKDLRDYLEHLERKGMLLRVKKEVSPRFEIAAGIRKTADISGPALLFENVKGYPDWRVVGGLFATRKLIAEALEVEDDEKKLIQRFIGWEQKRIKPKLVRTGPVKEVIIKGKDVDLKKLPVPTYCKGDVGPYLTAGIEIGKHPETGVQNVSIHRRLILDKDRTTIVTPPDHHIGMMMIAAEEKGQGCGVATVIGADPVVSLASQVNAPMGVDEMEIAGALMGEAVEVVKCETIDVEVPANAEVVIEGVSIPGERFPDGPFGEYPGNYISLPNYGALDGNPLTPVPVIKITAITMRKNPIFQALLSGKPMTENHYAKKYANLGAVWQLAQSVVRYPEDIKGIHYTPGGAATQHVVVAIHKRSEKDARAIIYTLLAAGGHAGSHNQLVTVVDDDIDIYDPVDVEWAVCTRMQPDRDIIILPTVPPPPGGLGPPVFQFKWGIDATAPLRKDRWIYDKAIPPGVEKVDYV